MWGCEVVGRVCEEQGWKQERVRLRAVGCRYRIVMGRL